MQRSERFDGSGAPFEGDRTVWVRSIPEGAQLRSAVLTLTPVAGPGSPLFEETITFTGASGTLGATQSRYDAGATHWTELDFHKRRTVSRLVGTGLAGAEVQVDLGGLYVQLNDVGAPRAPGDTLLTLGADGVLPGLAAGKFKLTGSHEMPVSQVILRSLPSNLTARAGAEPTFFSQPGELAQAMSTPDVAVALQQALAKADVDGGFYRLPLVIHSDALCRLDIELTVDFTVAQTALPGGLSETTLTYDFAGAPAAPAMTLAVPAGGHLVPTTARARAVGAFQESRIGYGPIGPVTPAGSLPLTAQQSLAVPIVVPADLDATAADLLLAATTPTALLQLNVVADTDGKPWNQPLLTRPVEVTIEHGEDDDPHWVSAALPATFTFGAGTRHWLTLQVESGEAVWSVVAASTTPATQQSRDGGLSWRSATVPGMQSAAALLRLRTVPVAFTMPIQLQVGEGPSATRVSLERFAQLGRVEVDLNAAEIVDGINSAVGAAAVAVCPTGEHVRNGDFAHWTRTADEPTGSRVVDAGFHTRRIAVAQACTAFIAGGAEVAVPALDEPGVQVQLAAVDVFADRVSASTAALMSGRVLSGLAGDPGGRYAYALLDANTVLTMDRDSGRSTLTTLAHDDANAVVASTDGSLLYVATSESVVAIPVDTVRSPGTGVWGTEISVPAPAVDVVSSTDGATLWALCDSDGRVSVVPIDTSRPAVGSPIELPSGATRLAVSANGSVLAAVHPGSGALSVINPLAGVARAMDLAESNDDPQPSAVAISADGHHAFVTLANKNAVALVDLAERKVLRRIPVGTAPADCAITPDGERLYVADAVAVPDHGNEDGFTVLTIGTLVPDDWVVTAGRVRPSCVPSGGRVAFVGAAPEPGPDAPPTATAAIAQVVAVASGCRYELTFQALASADGATAELHWRGDGCSESRVDTVPIQAALPRLSQRVESAPVLLPHRLLVSAPVDATQAEVRVQASAGIFAIVDDISLHATSSVLPNGGLSVFGDVLADFEVSPPSPSGFTATVDGGELVLHNGATAAVTVTQHASISAGQAYRLTVDAGSPTTGPSVDVVWTAAGQAVGSPVSVPVPPGASRPLMRSLPAPAGADTVEVRLVLPPGTELRLRRVTLDAEVTTQLPVSFLAESPGELTLTDWQVGYDLDETPRVPPLPAGGLCRPGVPQPVPGESDDRCYCPTCEDTHDITDPQPTTTATGTTGTVLTCTNCGAGVTLPGVIVRSNPAGGPVVVVSSPSGADVGAVLHPVSRSRAVPLDAVKGIGRATARRLNALGIVGIADLAATPLSRLAAVPRATEAMKRSWLEQARILASQNAASNSSGR